MELATDDELAVQTSDRPGASTDYELVDHDSMAHFELQDTDDMRRIARLLNDAADNLEGEN